MFLKDSKFVEITGPRIASWDWDWLQYYGWEVMDHPPYSPDLVASDFHPFGRHTKHLDGQQFA
jgi:hypothetical protein